MRLLLLIGHVVQLFDGFFYILQRFRILEHLVLRKKLHALWEWEDLQTQNKSTPFKCIVLGSCH